MQSEFVGSFKKELTVGTKVKDHLVYHETATGEEIVSTICTVLKTTNRALALCIANSLHQDGLIHEVGWTAILNDTTLELYKLKVAGSDRQGYLNLLADCYSPTCSRRNAPCYSSTCPRRFKEKERSTLSRPMEEVLTNDQSVAQSQELIGLSARETKRLAILLELIQTEEEYVQDLDILITHYLDRIEKEDILPLERRLDFVKGISNTRGILLLNRKLLDNLATDSTIGDILFEFSKDLSAYVAYCSSQYASKIALDLERKDNPKFASFVKSIESIKSFRKLPIESFLSRPVSRLGKYSLFLLRHLESTDDEYDTQLLNQALVNIREILGQINTQNGIIDNSTRIANLIQELVLSREDIKFTNLHGAGRLIVRDGVLTFKKEYLDVRLVLLDHCLLLLKKKDSKLVRRPMSLVVLLCEKGDNNSLIFTIPVRCGGSITLHASSNAEMTTWYDSIQSKQIIRPFMIQPLRFAAFPSALNCVCKYGNLWIFGCESGLYTSVEGDLKFTKVVEELDKITQVDLLMESLVVISDKSLFTIYLKDLNEIKMKPKKFGSMITYFKAGMYKNKAVICAVRSTLLNSNIKLLSIQQPNSSTSKIGKFFSPKQNDFIIEKEFYLPSSSSSIFFLSKSICLDSQTGFQIIDLDTGRTQELLDMKDLNLDFLNSQIESHPISLFRLADGFLVCYSDSAFKIDSNGNRMDSEFLIKWNCCPTSFMLKDNLIIACSPSLIEIFKLDDGHLVQVIHCTKTKAAAGIFISDCSVFSILDRPT